MTGRGCILKGKPSKQICKPKCKIQTKSHPKSSAPDCNIYHQLEIMNLELGCHYNPLKLTGWAGFKSLCAVVPLEGKLHFSEIHLGMLPMH